MSIPELVIAAGDPQGIGPEVAVKAALARSAAHLDEALVLVGLGAQLEALGLRANAMCATDAPQRGLRVISMDGAVPHGTGPSTQGGLVALRCLEAALARAQLTRGALITAPLAKHNVAEHAAGFHGHTEWLATQVGGEPLMLFSAPGLKLALATVHVPLSAVAGLIRAGAVADALVKLQRGLQQSYRIAAPRIHVLGLNPHAGEGGLIGSEEVDVIQPEIARARAQGMDVTGPWSADGYFAARRWRDADAVLALYHDQGLVALKAMSFGEAVNVTLGLPIVRTSVDHGCAFDLAGRGLADPSSMLAALNEARLLWDFRNTV